MTRTSRALRRLALAGLTLGVATAAGVVAPLAAAAAPVRPAATFAAVGDAVIGPGVQIETRIPGGAELCSSNFLFASGATVYLGTAAHCMAGAEASTSVDGCREPVLPDGTEVTIRGRDGSAHTGAVAYNSWATMQAVHESDPSTCLLNDFALVRLAPSDVADASPTIPGFGGPAGLNTGGTTEGERVYSYQPNQTAATPGKQGVSLGQPEGPRTHVVTTVPPGVPGDSGSGYVDADGRAFGSLSSLMVPTGTNGAADIAQALDYAARNANMGDVELVAGDRPFSAAGLPLTEEPSGPSLPALPLPRLLPSPLRG